MTWTDAAVEGGGVSVAVRDHGGTGPPVVLLHGATRTLADWGNVAPALAAEHRVVALDLRGHGHSGDGPWTFDAALGDVEAVVADRGMQGAAVVGHSVGGMVAALYGDRHPETPAVVNLDGHGPGRAAQYVGLDPDTVRQRLADARPYAMGPSGRTYDEDSFEIARMQQIAWASVNARDPYVVEEGFRRSLEGPDGDGLLHVRPDLPHATDMLAAIERLDLFEVYRRLPCPLLVVRAERPDPQAEKVPWLRELVAAHAKGLARDLDDLKASSPHVTVESIDATHAMLLDRPEEVAQMILSFLARARAASS